MTKEKTEVKKFDPLKFAMYSLAGLGIAVFVLEVICLSIGINGAVMKTCYAALGAIGGAFTTIMVAKAKGKKDAENM